MTTEYQAIIESLNSYKNRYKSETGFFFPIDTIIASIFVELGIDTNAPVGTTKHRYESYTEMMDTALPIFKEEQQAVRHDYPHIPCGVFEKIKNTEPKA